MYKRKVQSLFSTLVFIGMLLNVSINQAQSDKWEKLADIPTGRSYSSACEVNGKIYVIGGSATDKSCMNVMEVYDPKTNTWDISIAPMPTSRTDFCAAVVNGKIYVIGGTKGHTISGGELDVVEVYNPLTDTWETKTPMLVARRASACGVIGNKIYVAGGSPTSWFGSNTNKLDVYDPATDTWDNTKADMLKPLFGARGAVLDDKFYLVGGLHSGTWTGQKWVQIYDPATNSWELGPNLMYERFAHSVEVVDGKLYVIGGTNKSGGGLLDIIEEVEVYDPTEDTSWSKVDITPVLFKVHASSVYKDIIYSFSGGRMGGTDMTPVSDVYSYTPPPEQASHVKESFEFDGSARNYEVYLPQDYKANMPVVFALHGYSETIKWFKDYTLFHEYADTSGFILVYPEGSIASNGQPGWNTGLRDHSIGRQNTLSNDVGFISALIDTVINNYSVDVSRIYCCGFSMGGEMTYKLVGEIGERFAAVASVAGLINDNSIKTINPIRAFPVLHIHGDKDNIETWSGTDGNLWPVLETVDFWVQNNDCSPFYQTINLPDINTTDYCTVEKIIHKDYSNNPRVIFYKIINGGHSWPGSTFSFGAEGRKNMDINANEEIWNFFKDFTRSEETPTEPWTKKRDIPTPRTYSSACEVDGKIYVIGGCATDKTCMNVMEVYDPTNNTWETKTPMNTSRLSFGVGVVNGKIYVFGGTTGHTVAGGNLDVVEVYDPLTDTWETKTPMPVARRASACGVIGNKIYVAGGSPTSWWGSNTNKLDVYDPATDTWDITKADMPKSLFGPTGAVLGDKFYLIGGLHSGTWTGQKWVQIYDPATNNWELGPNLMYERFAHSVEVVDGKLYVIGGTNKSGGGPLDTIEEVEVYDPNENSSWTKIDDTPVLFKMHASSVYEDIIYSFSGNRVAGTNMTPIRDVYSFEPGKVLTSVREKRILPVEFTLYQNYPNPFNPSTTIKYSIPSRSVILSEAKNLKDFSSQAPQNDNANVTLKIYDILGREVATLVNQKQKSGNYEVKLDGSKLTSGIYFYRLQAGEFVETKKMILIK